MLKRGDPLVTLSPIWPVKDLNPRPVAPKTIASQLVKPTGWLQIDNKGAFTLDEKQRKATKIWRHRQPAKGLNRSQTSRAVA